MSKYYNPQRTKNLFDPKSKNSFRLSRSKIDLFLNCQRCFYLDRRLGVGQPPGYPFSLNSAVDTLLKKEFDIHRAGNSRHPLMNAYGIEAIPFKHRMLDTWRDPFRGIEYFHATSNFNVTGAIDDIWATPDEVLIIVDYKATSKNGEITLDADWQQGYKRQMEIYQWLFRQNQYKVSNIGYFVYCNGTTDRESFDGKLEFDVKIIPYEGDDSWIEETLMQIKNCLTNNTIPQSNLDCDFCLYRHATQKIEIGKSVQATLFSD